MKKESAKIQILNGSGIAGQAAKLKDLLSEQGYSQIETGNAPSSPSSKTVLMYTKSIDTKIAQDVFSILQSQYPKIASSEGKLVDFDLRIVSGKD